MWCEAGQAAEAFWDQTPRTIFAAITGYRRRRAWQVLQSAALVRWPQGEPLPTLADLADEPEPEPDEDELAEQNLQAARHLNSMLRAQQAALNPVTKPED